jgi:alkylhydroperoxidase family enzyme
MARIHASDAFAAIPTTDLGQGDRINLGVASIMSRLPDVAAAVGALTKAVRETGALSPRLMELVRLRIAFHNQCRSCMSIRYQSAIDDGLGEDAVCSLERPAEAPDLTDVERAALRFAGSLQRGPTRRAGHALCVVHRAGPPRRDVARCRGPA